MGCCTPKKMPPLATEARVKGHQATAGREFLKALADALGLEGVRRLEIIGGIDELLVAKVELLVDAKDEAGLIKATELIDIRLDRVMDDGNTEELERYKRVIGALPQSIQDDITDGMAEATEADANNAAFKASGGRAES